MRPARAISPDSPTLLDATTPPAPSRSLTDGLRSVLGLSRRFEIDGIVYTERSREPLRRALSRRGTGAKEFDVRFRDGSRQHIRCTARRVYADISGPALLPIYAQAASAVRPGMRVLDAACGTGYGAAWLLEQVGPSGAVVALTRDAEAAAYAQARYRAPGIAFEHGWTETLIGEPDGSFSGVVACHALTASDDPVAVIREWARLLDTTGWLLLAQPVPEPADPNADTPAPLDRADELSPRAMTPAELQGAVQAAIATAPPHADDTDAAAARATIAIDPAPPPPHPPGAAPTTAVVFIRKSPAEPRTP